jgi:hypothetical protein
MAANFASIDGAEAWIRVIQLIGLVCVAGAGITLWSVRYSRGRVWSLVLALALLYLVWFSFAFHLISLRIN